MVSCGTRKSMNCLLSKALTQCNQQSLPNLYSIYIIDCCKDVIYNMSPVVLFRLTYFLTSNANLWKHNAAYDSSIPWKLYRCCSKQPCFWGCFVIMTPCIVIKPLWNWQSYNMYDVGLLWWYTVKKPWLQRGTRLSGATSKVTYYHVKWWHFIGRFLLYVPHVIQSLGCNTSNSLSAKAKIYRRCYVRLHRWTESLYSTRS